MATTANPLAVTTRTVKGKGAARRTRREGKVPAVLYGHGTDPQHLSLPALEFAAILRNNGTNAVIDLDIEGSLAKAMAAQGLLRKVPTDWQELFFPGLKDRDGS